MPIIKVLSKVSYLILKGRSLSWTSPGDHAEFHRPGLEAGTKIPGYRTEQRLQERAVAGIKLVSVLSVLLQVSNYKAHWTLNFQEEDGCFYQANSTNTYIKDKLLYPKIWVHKGYKNMEHIKVHNKTGAGDSSKTFIVALEGPPKLKLSKLAKKITFFHEK